MAVKYEVLVLACLTGMEDEHHPVRPLPCYSQAIMSL